MIELATLPSLPGVTFEVAENEGERQAYYSVRTAAFAAVPGQPDGRPGIYDEDGLIIVARKEGQVVAGARMVLVARRPVLPVELAFPDYRSHLPPRIQSGPDCAEYGGLAVQPGTKDMSLTLGLYLHSERVARQHGIRHVFFGTDAVRARLYARAYRASYGKLAAPSTHFTEVCDFMPTTGSAWSAWGVEFRLCVVSFDYPGEVLP